VDLPIENGGSFHSYVSLPEVIMNIYQPNPLEVVFFIGKDWPRSEEMNLSLLAPEK
jgi:hypothetical protein